MSSQWPLSLLQHNRLLSNLHKNLHPLQKYLLFGYPVLHTRPMLLPHLPAAFLFQILLGFSKNNLYSDCTIHPVSSLILHLKWLLSRVSQRDRKSTLCFPLSDRHLQLQIYTDPPDTLYSLLYYSVQKLIITLQKYKDT